MAAVTSALSYAAPVLESADPIVADPVAVAYITDGLAGELPVPTTTLKFASVIAVVKLTL